MARTLLYTLTHLILTPSTPATLSQPPGTPHPYTVIPYQVFKKMLLERCQKEFEQDQETLIAEIEKLDEEDKALKVMP